MRTGTTSRAERVAGVLVRLYPRAWRDRYGDELLDLLAAAPVTSPMLLDLARGALDARLHLHQLLKGPARMTTRMRSVAITTFAAWLLFCFAASGVAKSTEDLAFTDAGHAHPVVAATRLVAGIAFGLSLTAVVVGGLPLLAAVARQAWRRRDRSALGLLAVPPAAAITVLAPTVLLGRVHVGPTRSTLDSAMFLGWIALGLAAATVSVLAVAALVRRSDPGVGALRVATWAASAAAAAMTLGLLAGAGYGLAVWTTTPALFHSADGILATPLPATWTPALIAALIAVATADRAALRGLAELRAAS
jgi:hypothetical protein